MFVSVCLKFVFTADLGTDGEIKIKIKYITTLHLIKMVRNIFHKGKTAKIDNKITNIREILFVN